MLEPKRAERLLAANAEIQVDGSIHLGKELHLVQRVKPRAAAGGGFAVGRAESGAIAAVDNSSAVTRPGELSTEELAYAFEPAEAELAIRDAGLRMSYGIFGAPGSGKTHLLLYLLGQLLRHEADDPDSKFGGLILDPKAALTEEIAAMVAAAGRTEDLIVLSTDELTQSIEQVNVIDCALGPYELGRTLVLAGQSAGTAATEPFWFGTWKNLFGAALHVLSLRSDEAVTLRELVDAVLVVEPGDDLSGGRRRRIERYASELRHQLAALDDDEAADATRAINQVEGFYRQELKSTATVDQLITTAYAAFQEARYRCYSPTKSTGRSIYDRIIDEGKIVLVSLSKGEPGMAKVLSTLVKVIFQQTVLSRLARVRAPNDDLRNFVRPLLLACDEYSDVASEVPGEVGDADFFSQARQQGCMALVATQSVEMLESSSLKEHWRAVFSNFGATVFMRLAGTQTAEEAGKLVGETDWYITSQGASQGKDGLGSSRQKELRERKALPSHVLTQVLKRGQAVVVGSLDGSRKSMGTSFVQVPGPVGEGLR